MNDKGKRLRERSDGKNPEHLNKKPLNKIKIYAGRVVTAVTLIVMAGVTVPTMIYSFNKYSSDSGWKTLGRSVTEIGHRIKDGVTCFSLKEGEYGRCFSNRTHSRSVHNAYDPVIKTLELWQYVFSKKGLNDFGNWTNDQMACTIMSMRSDGMKKDDCMAENALVRKHGEKWGKRRALVQRTTNEYSDKAKKLTRDAKKSAQKLLDDAQDGLDQAAKKADELIDETEELVNDAAKLSKKTLKAGKEALEKGQELANEAQELAKKTQEKVQNLWEKWGQWDKWFANEPDSDKKHKPKQGPNKDKML